MAQTGNDIAIAAKLLTSGEVVAIPTETVYGLAANALDINAVSKIFSIKNRPFFDPLILHTDDLDKIKPLLKNVPNAAVKLLDRFAPGPLTILLPKTDAIPDLATSGLPLVAIRVPNHPLTLRLLAGLDFPLAAPSANPFGYISPTTAAHVDAQLGQSIPYILDGGPSTIGIESTIIGFENDKVVIYRMGGTALEDLQSFTGYSITMQQSTSAPASPGMLVSHYAPSKRLILGNIIENIQTYGYLKIGILSYTEQHPGEYSYRLTQTDDMNEASANLFSYLRLLDESPVDIIVAEKVPDRGLGRAINDRLVRAAGK